MCCTKRQQRKTEESKRLRGQGDEIKFIDLRFEREQVFRNSILHRNISASLLNNLKIIEKYDKENLGFVPPKTGPRRLLSKFNAAQVCHLFSLMVMNWTLELLLHNLVSMFHSISLGSHTSYPLLSMYL